MIEEDKVALTLKRAELVARLTEPLATAELVRLQAELTLTNAKIKALNTAAAAQLKAEADRRKIAGLAEAHANAARAMAVAKRKVLATPAAHTDATDDPAQAAAIDAWITVVVQDSGIKVRRTRTGLDFVDVPAKWLVVLQRLRTGIHAAARGEELPEAEPEAEVPPPKTKKR